MYGLVNKAVEDLVCTHFGEDTWEAIKQQANVDVDVFVSMDAYPDDVTYRLVGAASEVLRIPPEQVLETFGEYWVQYTAREGYGALLKLSGASLPAFLLNLNNMHARIGLTMPHLKPPTFHCIDVRDDSLRLQYYSTRPGLTPMVVGLLKGLGAMYNTPINVTQTASRNENTSYDEFLIQFKDVSAV